MKLLVLLPVLSLACCGPQAVSPRGLLVLGVDGMDPGLVERFAAAGLMPNAAQLKMTRLATTNPPQSPVAWSTFMTGLPPEAHGIFDFIHRDPQTLAPFFSTARTEPGFTLAGIKLGSDHVVSLRRGPAFWDVLSAHGIASTLLHVPTAYPAEAGANVELLAGMGVPDLTGGYGTFSVLTNDPVLAASHLSGGRSVMLSKRGEGTLEGPLGQTVPVVVRPVSPAGSLIISSGDYSVLVSTRAWSTWLPLRFARGVSGIVRFYATTLGPYLTVYASPVQVDPSAAALPIASPPDFAQRLQERIGTFHTLGIAEDAKGLAAGILDPSAFIADAEQILLERQAELMTFEARAASGLLFVYISTLDQMSHAFYADAEKLAWAYARVDEVIGLAIRAAKARQVPLLVMSDHGFAPFSRVFSLNAWLRDKGFERDAYGVGFNGLYLSKDARPNALAEVSAGLLQEKAITRVTPVVSDSPYAPSAIVNYARGYRVASDSALGLASGPVDSDNTEGASGDHLSDPRDVPGVMLVSEALGEAEAIGDLAGLVLRYFKGPLR